MQSSKYNSMAFNIILPSIKKKATAKDCIIYLLGYDWPLTAKKLYASIKKSFGLSITYQAVYKAIQELVQEGVVEKKENSYQINLKWLKELHSYTEIVQTNYFTKNRLKLIEGIKEARAEGNISLLTFETLFDVEKYLYYLQKHYILNSKEKDAICVHHNHEWRPLFYLRAEYNWVRKVKQLGNKTYVLCASKTALDKWCAGFYKRIGCNIKLGVNCANLCELMVFGDYVIQVYLPKAIKDGFSKNFNNIKNIEELELTKLFSDIFERKAEIQVIVNKDKKLAEQIKENTLAYFKK